MDVIWRIVETLSFSQQPRIYSDRLFAECYSDQLLVKSDTKSFLKEKKAHPQSTSGLGRPSPWGLQKALGAKYYTLDQAKRSQVFTLAPCSKPEYSILS